MVYILERLLGGDRIREWQYRTKETSESTVTVKEEIGA